MVRTIGDGDNLTRSPIYGFHESFSSSQHLDTELHTATYNGLCRQHGRQVDGHVTRRSDGEKHLHSIVVELSKMATLSPFCRPKLLRRARLRATRSHTCLYVYVFTVSERQGRSDHFCSIQVTNSGRVGMYFTCASSSAGSIEGK